MRRIVVAVRRATDCRNSAGLAQAAHALKGAVCNLTDKAVFQTTVELETLARTGALDRADQVLHRLEVEMAQLIKDLSLYMEENGRKAFGAST